MLTRGISVLLEYFYCQITLKFRFQQANPFTEWKIGKDDTHVKK